MKSIQPPPTTSRNLNCSCRRPDLFHCHPLLQSPLNTSQTPNSKQQPSQPFNLSELNLMNRIGSGGTVYKVIHRPTGQLFALKVIYGNHNDDVRRQICREIGGSVNNVPGLIKRFVQIE